ncbi:hypothetical protein JQN72_04490 [Phycicoccus sp. CSK15P-2]|uniref:DUF6270 domain-containing protein n=1 Tax=Phycicoccus sp. CSK15P-2 TaxID=2807627 RepID=UPI00194F660B|nr:DUF6270 domain-containing protein [Phycicoccus sp. CSK15P-2]MBM6403500.1 hypothetical protein [Phycicoccus sp. CSK15P-2]
MTAPERPHAPARTVLIYGSCVSRDTFEYLQPLGYRLVDYVARQSLVSAFSAVDTALLVPFEADSAFQRRMLENDWRASLVPTLEAKGGRADVLLWDLCDERLGIRELSDGGFVTRSVDLISTGVDARMTGLSALVDLGSPRHLELWTEALSSWRSLLSRAGLLERLVLLAPPWAEKTRDGAASPTSFGRTARQANALFDIYHERAANLLGCPVVSLDRGEARSDSDHRWGLAPFHYTEQNYVSLAAGIDSAVSALLQDGVADTRPGG